MTQDDLLTLAQRLREYNHNPHHINPVSDAFHRLITDSADALSQLAAIQGGMGEVVEVVAVLYKSGDVLTAEECGIALDVCAKVETPLMTVAQHQRITAAMAAEVERLQFDVATLIEAKNGLVEECNGLHDENAELRHERDALRAELAEVKGREAVPVAWHTEDHLEDKSATTYRKEVAERWRSKGWPIWTLYASPPASPDVEGLVKALEKIAFRAECFAEEERDMPPHSCEVVAGIAEDALTIWRQAHTPSTLPASSAEE